MLRLAVLFLVTLPMAACQLALPIAATQVAVPIATSQTVLRGCSQMVEIRTDPPGATVTIPGYETRTTPTFIMLARGHSHTVRIAKDGFKNVTTNIASRRDPNADASNVIGGALDVASGAAWELNPDRLTITLESLTPVAATSVASADAPVVDPLLKTSPQLGQPPLPSDANDRSTILADQLARLDRLLDQGVITKREHKILTALAHSAVEIAGATTSP